MVITNEDKFFYTFDSNALKSKEEMLEWIRGSNDDAFAHHVTQERNDFSGWTKEVLKDGPLSKKLKPGQSREDMIEAIEQRLLQQNKKKNKKKEIISKLKKATSNE